MYNATTTPLYFAALQCALVALLLRRYSGAVMVSSPHNSYPPSKTPSQRRYNGVAAEILSRS
jgi:hypothetical protein